MIHQGTISQILGDSYAYLDNIEKKRDKEELKNRKRFSIGD